MSCQKNVTGIAVIMLVDMEYATIRKDVTWGKSSKRSNLTSYKLF